MPPKLVSNMSSEEEEEYFYWLREWTQSVIEAIENEEMEGECSSYDACAEEKETRG